MQVLDSRKNCEEEESDKDVFFNQVGNKNLPNAEVDILNCYCFGIIYNNLPTGF